MNKPLLQTFFYVMKGSMKGKKPQGSKLRKAFIAATAAMGVFGLGTLTTTLPKDPASDTTRVLGMNTGYNMSITDQYWKSTLPQKTDEQTAQDLFTAAEEGDSWRTRQILDRGLMTDEEADLFSYAFFTYSVYNQALSNAASKGHSDVVGVLLGDERYKDFRAATLQNGEALIRAVQGRHLKSANLLIAASANVNAQNGRALTIAASNKNPATAIALLNAGADVNANNGTALRYAAAANDMGMVQLLAERGADIKAHGSGALVAAAYHNNLEMVKFLTAADADATPNNNLALRIAKNNGNTEMMRVLSEASLTIVRDDNGTVSYYNATGELHRLNGPAVTRPDGTKVWYQNGQLARDDGGPAVEWASGQQEWWSGGRLIQVTHTYIPPSPQTPAPKGPSTR